MMVSVKTLAKCEQLHKKRSLGDWVIVFGIVSIVLMVVLDRTSDTFITNILSTFQKMGKR